MPSFWNWKKAQIPWSILVLLILVLAGCHEKKPLSTLRSEIGEDSNRPTDEAEGVPGWFLTDGGKGGPCRLNPAAIRASKNDDEANVSNEATLVSTGEPVALCENPPEEELSLVVLQVPKTQFNNAHIIGEAWLEGTYAGMITTENNTSFRAVRFSHKPDHVVVVGFGHVKSCKDRTIGGPIRAIVEPGDSDTSREIVEVCREFLAAVELGPLAVEKGIVLLYFAGP